MMSCKHGRAPAEMFVRGGGGGARRPHIRRKKTLYIDKNKAPLRRNNSPHLEKKAPIWGKNFPPYEVKKDPHSDLIFIFWGGGAASTSPPHFGRPCLNAII